MTSNGMGARTAVTAALVALTACLGVPPAQAEVLTFHATLDGKSGAEPTGSAATGSARIKVDTVSRRVSIDMTLEGITIAALSDKLVAAPIGPIHFHKYASAAGGHSVLVLPLPYGADYRATKTGLRVTTAAFDYGPRAGLLKPALPFDDFVAALRGGLVALNVHTDAFNPGEIGGALVEKRSRWATPRPIGSGRAGSSPASQDRTSPASGRGQEAGQHHAHDEAV